MARLTEWVRVRPLSHDVEGLPDPLPCDHGNGCSSGGLKKKAAFCDLESRSRDTETTLVERTEDDN